MRARSILLVAYFYPPSRDTGALRPQTMAKYLRRMGHRVTVLTTSAYGSDGGDEDAVRTADLQRVRARLHGKSRIDSLYDRDSYAEHPHPLSRVLVPEPLVLAWAPFALARARRLNRRRPFDCVITTSPPESVHLVGRSLQRRGVPWIAELRDAWRFEPLRPTFPTGFQRRIDQRLELRWLRSADAVVCVSRPVADDLRERLGIEPVLIPSGWDPEAAPPVTGGGGPFDPDRVSLLYTGRFGSYGRDPAPLARALRLLASRDPDAAAGLQLVIAGPLTSGERALFDGEFAPLKVTIAGTVPRERALALQRSADALLLLAAPARSQLLNFKLFEYLAAGRPILALAEGTEAGRIAAEVGAEVAPADDPSAIAATLVRLASGEITPPDPAAIAPYTYPGPSQRMAEAVDLAISRRSH